MTDPHCRFRPGQRWQGDDGKVRVITSVEKLHRFGTTIDVGWRWSDQTRINYCLGDAAGWWVNARKVQAE